MAVRGEFRGHTRGLLMSVRGEFSWPPMGTFPCPPSQTRWRAVNAPPLVALVRAGVVFEKGVMAERSEEGENEGDV